MLGTRTISGNLLTSSVTQSQLHRLRKHTFWKVPPKHMAPGFRPEEKLPLSQESLSQDSFPAGSGPEISALLAGGPGQSRTPGKDLARFACGLHVHFSHRFSLFMFGGTPSRGTAIPSPFCRD